MTQERNLRVFYNGSCPVCSREIAHYRHAAERARAGVQFSDTESGDIKALGMTPDDARRRLHVLDGGELKAGLPAFQALWRRIPRWRWLATVTGWPGVRQGAEWVYEGAFAPGLYCWDRHRRWRTRRRVTRAARARIRSRPAA